LDSTFIQQIAGYLRCLVIVFPFIGMLIFFVVIIHVISHYNNQTSKRKKDVVLSHLQQIDNKVCLDVDARLSGYALFGFKIRYTQAEVFITRNSIICFLYRKNSLTGILGKLFPMRKYYNGFMQLYQSRHDPPKQLMERGFLPLKSVQFKKQNLIIKYNYKLAWCTLTLKSIENPEQVKVIEELLYIDPES